MYRTTRSYKVESSINQMSKEEIMKNKINYRKASKKTRVKKIN